MAAAREQDPSYRIRRRGDGKLEVSFTWRGFSTRGVADLELGVWQAARGNAPGDLLRSDMLQLEYPGHFRLAVELQARVDCEKGSSARFFRRREFLLVVLTLAEDQDQEMPPSPQSPDPRSRAIRCAWPKQEVWPTNGYRLGYFMWRLVLRPSDELPPTGFLRYCVGVQLEQLDVRKAEWPPDGLQVRVSLKPDYCSEEVLASTDVVLTIDHPIAEVVFSRHRRGLAIIADHIGEPWPKVLSGFADVKEPYVSGNLIPVTSIVQALALERSHLQKDCIVPLPLPDLPSELWPMAGNFESTGGRMWDAGVVLGFVLPRLLKRLTPDAELLELGCGIGNTGIYLALLGFRCIATDMEDQLEVPRGVAERNSAGIASAGGHWCARGLDWQVPPAWALERKWQVIFGADLLYDSGVPGIHSPDRLLEQDEDSSKHHAFLTLLSRLRFDEFLLAERQRSISTMRDFFERLPDLGMEALKLPVDFCCRRGESKGTPLTKAVDIEIWQIRHL